MRTLPITELSTPRSIEAFAPADASATTATDSASSVSFADVLMGAVDSANRADAVASGKVDALARGMSDDLHGTMIAVKEADVSIKLVAAVRNKLLDAFTELWKTSV
jgi:flagellar hook-basal body complex protein FliE